MADAQDAISRLQIQSSAPGTDEAADSMNKLAAAYGAVTVASVETEKSTASLDSKFASIERRLVDGVKAQQDYAKIQSTVNAAVAQNPALTDRANAVLAAAKQRYEEVSGSQSLFEKGLDAAKDKASELTRELGPLGSALNAIGPAGLAIGGAIGIAILALDKLKEQANEAGRWAAQLQNAANVIGLDTEQLQALNEAAAEVGVTSADNIAAFQKFAVSLGQLKDGSGQLYAELTKVNPALAAQLSVAKDTAGGWNILAQAYASAGKEQQALLARAAFGRGGAAQGGVLLATANAGGVAGLQADNEDAIAKEQVKRWAELTTQINSATEAAARNFQSIFTDAILTREKNFAENMLNVSRYAREFSLSEDWKSFVAFLNNPATTTVLGLLARAAVPLSGLASSAVSALTSKAPPSMKDFSSPANSYSTFQQAATPQADNPTGPGSPAFEAARLRDLVTALGSAATARDRYNATVATSRAALDEASKSADSEAIVVARAIAGRVQSNAALELATSLQSAYVSALGQSASVSDIVLSRQIQLQKLQQQNPQITDAMIQKQLALTQSQALGTFQISAQTDAEKVKIATLTMSTEAGTAYQIVQTKINEAIAAGKPLNADEIAQLQQKAEAYAKVKAQADLTNTVIGDLKGGAEAFGNTLVQGLMSGKSAMDALSAAAKSLGQALVSSGIKNAIEGLASGNFVQAAIGGAEAIAGALLGSDNAAAKEKKNQEAVQAYVRQQQFIQQAQLAGIDQSTLSGKLQAFDIDAQQQRLQEQLAGGQAMVQLEASLAAQRKAIVQKSVDDARKTLQDLAAADKSDVAQKLDAIHTAADQLSTALQTLGASTAEVATGVAAAVAKVKTAFDSDLQSKINSASGKGYLNDLKSLVDQRTQLLSDSAALGSDPSQVATYFSAAAQGIVDSAQLTGDAFNDLTKQFPQLTGVVHQFTGSLKDLQDQISQYLASLQVGNLSTLSPTDKLNASAQQFQQILAAVQAGDFTKSSQLTSAADTYLNQAQSYFASSAGYANVYDAVTSALQSVSGVAGFGPASVAASSPVSSIGSAVPGVVMPQATTIAAANDNGAFFQQQTTALTNVLMQGFNGLGGITQSSNAQIADLLRQVLAVLQQQPKPLRPNAIAGVA